MAQVLKASEENLKRAAEIIRKGGLVAFPTETVYGLGGDAFNPDAVARIFEVKERPTFDPIIVHIADFGDIKRLCREIDERAKILAEKFWPGPLTMVLKKSEKVPDIVTAGLDTIAVRMPSHPVARKLIEYSKTPIAAPSANLFGKLSPTTAEHVKEQLGERIDMIIDGGKCPVGVESTVIDLSVDPPVILRPGGTPAEEIEKVIGKVSFIHRSDEPKSPGQLKKHYSPRTPLRIIRGEIDVGHGEKAGLLAFKQPDDETARKFEKIEVLSSSDDLNEALRQAAQNLFSALHRLDKANLDVIYAEPVPEIGLGRAIMDRLRKAEGMG